MAGALPNPLMDPTGPTNARMRVGTVQSSPAPQGDFVWVAVDGTVIKASYFTNYVPVTGDRVIVTQDDTDWFVLGGKAGYAGNLVPNSTFVAHPQAQLSSSLPPYMWTQYVASGVSPLLCVGLSSAGAFGPIMICASTVAGASDSYAYSAAFPVQTGRTLYVDATGDLTSSGGATLQGTLRVGWYSNGQTAYAGFASETVIDTRSTTGLLGGFWMTGSVTVPAGVTYARVAMRANFAGGGSGFLAYTYRVEAHQ